jgi:hypothetical protein
MSGTPLITSTLLNAGNPLFASVPYVHRFGGVAIVLTDDMGAFKIATCGTEGEIWLSNESVGLGYWNNPDLTKEIFQNVLPPVDESDANLAVVNPADRKFWLRTGDLGYMEKGHLFISGRKKDLVIINGKNYYPQDIELRVQQYDEELIRPGCVAVFAVTDSFQDSECFVVVCEVRDQAQHQLAALEQMGNNLFQDLLTEFQQALLQIVFIKERTIPKTTSGKLKRSLTKTLWKDEKLSEILRVPSTLGASHPKNLPKMLTWVEPIIQELISPFHDVIPVEVMTEFCFRIVTNYQIIEKDENLSSQGIDSLKVGELYYEITNHSPIKQYHSLFFADVLATEEINDLTVIKNVNALFEWTGKDLIIYICTGRLPEAKGHIIYSQPVESSITNGPIMGGQRKVRTDEESHAAYEREIKASYSPLLRIVCESIGIVLIALTIVVSLFPSIAFYDAFEDLGGTGSVLGLWQIGPTHNSEDIVWISYGVVLILCTPIFTISFTAVVILQRVVIWPLIKTGEGMLFSIFLLF